jgi:hypothetical protein
MKFSFLSIHNVGTVSNVSGALKALAVSAMLFLMACSADTGSNAQSSESAAAAQITMDIYKSPTCGCCTVWQDHAQERGFAFRVHHMDNNELTMEKLRRGINLRYHSCHTTVAEDGSVFEGHIPAYLVHQYLADKPADSIGLAVPGMPLGSPGMEAGDRLDPYDVLLLKADGSSEVYAQITDLQSQYQ